MLYAALSTRLCTVMQEKKSTNENFSKRLASAMEEIGYNNATLSRVTNISKSAIGNYLEGGRTPRAEELYKISHALKKSMNWLMGDDDFNGKVVIREPDMPYPLEVQRLKSKLRTARKILQESFPLALEALKEE